MKSIFKNAALFSALVSFTAGAAVPPRTISINSLAENDIRKKVAQSGGVIEFAQPDGRVEICNTWVLNENTLVTNQHCISRDAEIISHFNVNTEGKARINHRCQEVIGSNTSLDYALVRCDGIGSKVKPVTIDDRKVKRNERVFAVTHFMGEEHCRRDFHCSTQKSISEGNAIARESGTWVTSDAGGHRMQEIVVTNAFGKEGTSGSAFFSSEGKVIGLLNSGSDNKANFVPIHRVVGDIKERYPNVAMSLKQDEAREPAAGPPAQQAVATLEPAARTASEAEQRAPTQPALAADTPVDTTGSGTEQATPAAPKLRNIASNQEPAAAPREEVAREVPQRRHMDDDEAPKRARYSDEDDLPIRQASAPCATSKDSGSSFSSMLLPILGIAAVGAAVYLGAKYLMGSSSSSSSGNGTSTAIAGNGVSQVMPFTYYPNGPQAGGRGSVPTSASTGGGTRGVVGPVAKGTVGRTAAAGGGGAARAPAAAPRAR